MKIATQDKREGGCRHGEENRGKAGKLICLGDGMSQGREEKGWINGGRVKRWWKWRWRNKLEKEHILGGYSATDLCYPSNTFFFKYLKSANSWFIFCSKHRNQQDSTFNSYLHIEWWNVKRLRSFWLFPVVLIHVTIIQIHHSSHTLGYTMQKAQKEFCKHWTPPHVSLWLQMLAGI